MRRICYFCCLPRSKTTTLDCSLLYIFVCSYELLNYLISIFPFLPCKLRQVELFKIFINCFWEEGSHNPKCSDKFPYISSWNAANEDVLFKKRYEFGSPFCIQKFRIHVRKYIEKLFIYLITDISIFFFFQNFPHELGISE